MTSYETVEAEHVERYLELTDRILASYPDYNQGLFVGLSGGVDSASALKFACRYADQVGWNRRKIRTVFCSRKNSYPAEEEDLSYARQLAKDTEVSFQIVDITAISEALDVIIAPTNDFLDDERIARARALPLHTIYEKERCLSVDSTNLSEDLLGQWTAGCYNGQVNFLCNLFKTEVYPLAEELGVPENIRNREKVTSELRSGTMYKDYTRLDPILFHYVLGKNAQEITLALDEDEKFVQEVIKRVEGTMIRANGGIPIVDLGDWNNLRDEYDRNRDKHPFFEKLHERRLRRWIE